VLRECAIAGEDLPPFDRAAMDGYALSFEDDSERFRVVGEVQPGASAVTTIRHGECVRIFTGAPIPAGASQVLMQEDVRREGEWMIPARRGKEKHIRFRGEDARQGSVQLAAGIRLGAGELAILAHLGITAPHVTRPIRVLHLVTGNELVDPSRTPGPGEIRDSNSTLVAALLAEQGAQLIAQHRCGDALRDLLELVRGHDDNDWDALLISGGASVGDYDFGARLLLDLGFTIHFDRINLRPGKPTIFATRGRQIAFVIPGNPVSHFVVFHVVVRRALEALAGAPSNWPLTEALVDAETGARADTRETFWPARLSLDGRSLTVSPLHWQSSGDMRGLASVDALLQIPAGAGNVQAGGVVRCLLLDHFNR
jgi:molybdopterin molybdotransferase